MTDMCESKVRQPQVGDVYDVRVRVTGVDTRILNQVEGVWEAAPTHCVAFSRYDFLAHATLVKAAERPFKVGERVKLSGYPPDLHTRQIVALFEDDDGCKWATYRSWAGYSTTPLSGLRHADEAEEE